jgi:hypothetical protein
MIAAKIEVAIRHVLAANKVRPARVCIYIGISPRQEAKISMCSPVHHCGHSAEAQLASVHCPRIKSLTPTEPGTLQSPDASQIDPALQQGLTA